MRNDFIDREKKNADYSAMKIQEVMRDIGHTLLADGPRRFVISSSEVAKLMKHITEYNQSVSFVNGLEM